MKILHCYIENFGKHSHVEYTFQEGITEICQQNGFGKTTFAAFLKAMFYGLPSVKTNSKDFNDRQRFFPFHGGKFGGNLTFAYQDKVYKIERFFDKKSEAKDSITIYCNNRIYHGFSRELGREIFQLDKESFERTTFLSSDFFEMHTTSTIQAKLNQLIHNTTETIDSQHAFMVLEEAKKYYKANRGKGGKLQELQDKITESTYKIRAIDHLSNQLDAYYIDCKNLQQEILALEEKIKDSNQHLLTASHYQQYERYINSIKNIQQDLSNLQKSYPQGIPTIEELTTLRLLHNTLLQLAGQKNVYDSGHEENLKKLEELSLRFASTPLSTQDFKEITDCIERCQAIQLEIDIEKRHLHSVQHTKLFQKFSDHEKVKNDLLHIAQNLDKIEQIQNQLQSKENKKNDKKVLSQKMRTTLIFILFAFAIPCIVFASYLSKPYALLLLIAGGVLFLTALYLVLSREKNTSAIISSSANKENILQLQNECIKYFEIYELSIKRDIKNTYIVLQEQWKNYQDYLLEDNTLSTKIAMQEQEYQINFKKILQFLIQFGFPANTDLLSLKNNFQILQTLFDTYLQLQKEKDSSLSSFQNIEEQLIENREKINQIFIKYALPLPNDISSTIDTLQHNRQKWNALENNCTILQEEANKYRIQYGLKDSFMKNTDNVEELQKLLEIKKQNLLKIEGEISNLENDIEFLEEKKMQLQNDEENYLQCQKRYQLITQAIEFLKIAEQNLKDKYIAPLQNSYDSFALEKVLGKKMHIDADLNLTFEDGGERRKELHLSAGQRTLCALSFRLALIENIFGENKPFLILDDPFINLDAVNMQQSLLLLKDLAKNRQIIYLCCHESRKIV